MAHVHPKWTGDIENGYDAALLRLPEKVQTATPHLASAGFHLYPNSKVYGFHLGGTLQVAKFDVVANSLCPLLNNLDSSMFCAYASSASMCSGRLINAWYVE